MAYATSLAAVLIFLLSARLSYAASDADIFALIESLRPLAASIQINGDPSDWVGVPAFSDPAGDAGGDDSRDITRAAIAPGETDLFVLIRTNGNPVQVNGAFSLDVDFHGRSRPDVTIDLHLEDPHVLTIFPEGQPERSRSLTGLEVSFTTAVEVRIPYAALARALPFDLAAALSRKSARSFLRVRPRSHASNGSVILDYGPEVASFRLLTTPYKLDPPLPQPGVPALAVELPLDGKWFIHQGAFANTGSHSTRWAYDLSIRDAIGFRSNPPDSALNDDYYNWDQPVFSPAAARVLEIHNDSPDGNPLENPTPPVPPDNRVLLDLGNNIALSLRHFRQESVAVAEGDLLDKDDFLATVGDSGNSGAPHLHMMFMKLPQVTTTLPIALTKARVSLNSTANDPWARDLAVWEPREGFFVEPLAQYNGPLAVAAFSLPQAEVNVNYSAAVQILGGAPPYVVAVVKGFLPAGLSIKGSFITGTPSQARRARFTLQVTDQNNSSVTKNLVLSTVKQLTIATARLAPTRTGKSYKAQLKVAGGKGPYVWSIVSGALPGIAIDANTGLLVGTPASPGVFNAGVRVTDALGGSAEKTLSLTVK